MKMSNGILQNAGTLKENYHDITNRVYGYRKINNEGNYYEGGLQTHSAPTPTLTSGSDTAGFLSHSADGEYEGDDCYLRKPQPWLVIPNYETSNTMVIPNYETSNTIRRSGGNMSWPRPSMYVYDCGSPALGKSYIQGACRPAVCKRFDPADYVTDADIATPPHSFPCTQEQDNRCEHQHFQTSDVELMNHTTTTGPAVPDTTSASAAGDSAILSRYDRGIREAAFFSSGGTQGGYIVHRKRSNDNNTGTDPTTTPSMPSTYESEFQSGGDLSNSDFRSGLGTNESEWHVNSGTNNSKKNIDNPYFEKSAHHCDF